MAHGSRVTRRLGPTASRLIEPGLIAGILAAVYLITDPNSADYAAQTFRTGLFERQGLSAWNNLWFGGHHLPGYGFILPLLGSLVTPRVVASAATIASALLFAEIAYRHWGERARIGVVWFAASTSISLFTGRLTFAVGVAIALAAVFALQAGRRGVALALAALCPLGSPVAALFLAAAAVTYAVAERKRVGLELAAVAVGVVALVSFAFPEGGSEPFVASSFQPAILIAALAVLLIPKQERLLRYGVAAYALALVAAFAISSPMGGNATRMGALLLGPLLACALWRRERMILFLVVPVIAYWQWSPVARDLETVYAQPSVKPDYYAPVVDFLRKETAGNAHRVEVLPAAHHWESAYVPKGIFIARGWQRQLDRKLNPLFYDDDPLRPGVYRRWLDDLAVGYVAVPDAELDYAAESEARLIASRPGYLEPVFRSPEWTVYEVRDAAPIASGAATHEHLGSQGFTVRADSAGTALVRVRWTRYWTITAGSGCLEESPEGFTRVSFQRPGRLVVRVRFTPWRILGDDEICSVPAVDDSAPGRTQGV